MSLLGTLFTHPMDVSGNALWVVIPLSLAVAAVYKTIRADSIRHLPREIVLLTLYILAGVVALMLAGWTIISLKS
jgi:hypothetical protein